MATGRRGTMEFTPGYFSPEVQQAMTEACTNQAKVATDARKATPREMEKIRASFLARAKRAAAGRLFPADYIEKYMPADSLSAFLTDADAFGFHNNKTHVLPESWRLEFNRFLEANAQTIKFGVMAYAGIPQEWLDKHGPLPGIGESAKDASAKLVTELTRANYRLILNEDDENIPPNYYIWMSIFDALKLVDRFRKEQAAGK